ncbi:MAG: Long-chain-fatty-acid--CoA ligase FadD15 [Alphaproteobacteria bacterium MarineAlpha5_Bin9]|nr:MAG: Long-chain-fatty-acid--CoA ligase FadD15 [Alphaproteobacteria bacterium MarineAlpha5_Bin9]
MTIDYDKIRNVLDIFNTQVKKYGNKPYLWEKIEGKYRSYSWNEISEKVSKFSSSLLNQGILAGDRVVIVSENRPEWQIADLAIMAIGAITVPAYITSTTADYKYIIEHSGARLAIVSNNNLAEKVIPAITESKKCNTLIKIENDKDQYDKPLNILSWTKLVNENSNNPFDLHAAEQKLKLEDVACIIYTSGTGGNPKGVMLSHKAMITNCKGASIILKEITSELNELRFLSWLPLSHSYEHTLQFFKMGSGGQIYYAEGIDKLLVNMSEAKPHIMTAVPRFYDSLHTRISQGLKQQSKLSNIFFTETVRLGKKNYYGQKLSFFERITNNFLDKIVRKKVKKRFGGHLKALVSGGSALNFEVGLFLSSLGLPLLQGFGQTESGPVVSVNPPKKIKLDTVGPPLEGVQVNIADDGEILVKGDNLMNGYWDDPSATAITIKNGWLHTGDIGQLDEDGYLKITDRKKDIIVNAGGDNISPSKIEEKINIEAEISQSMIYGDYKNYMVAVIVPDFEYLKIWCSENNKVFELKDLLKDEDFNNLIKSAINKANKKLSVIEQVRKFIIIDHSFSVENEMMTPTMKVRRFAVKEKYKDSLEQLYK